MDTITTKNLIIGGGLSGLSLAYFLKDDDYLIVEKDDTLGGYCRTIKNPNYVWDYAGHFYHFKTEKYKKLFLSLVDPEEIVFNTKNTKIFYKDKLINYPFQSNIHELSKEEFIDCLYDLYTKDTTEQYDNFLDMLYAKFGKSIVEKFLKPYNEKLYAVDLKQLDKDAMGRFFPYADFDSIIRNMKEEKQTSYNDTFMYLKQGTGYFIDRLADCLDQDKIMTDVEIVKIDQKQKTALTSKGQKIKYQNLINTIPYNQFLKLLDDDKYNQISDQLSYNKVLVFNIGFDKPSPRFKEEHWVYFPDKKLNFYRIGFYNNILNQEKMSIYVEIGFPKAENQKIDFKEEFKKTIEGLHSIGAIDDTMKVVDHCTLFMDPAYVHISNADDKIVKQTFEEFEQENIYHLGRYGRWTYNCMEDCIGLADQLATKIKA